MTFSRRLLVSELQGQAALLVCSGLVSLTYAIWISVTGDVQLHWSRWDAQFLLVAAAATYLYGLLPMALFGAPLYALADHFGKAGWLAAIGIGVIPGAATFVVSLVSTPKTTDVDFFDGTVFGICGVFVAGLTHVLYRRSRGIAGGV